MKKSKALQLFISIAIIILAFVIAILANSISLDKSEKFFSVERLKETLHDVMFMLQTAGIALLLETTYVGVYSARDAVNKSGKIWVDTVSEYETAIKTKNENYKDFVECIRTKNFELKKEAYRKKFEKMRIKYQTKYERISNEKLNSKHAKKIKSKLEFAENKLNDNKIDEAVLKSNVKYEKIHIEDFGRVISGNVKGKYDFKNRQNQKFTASAVYKLCSKIVWATIFSAVSLQAFWKFNFGSGFWIIMSSCGLGCLMTMASGINIADKLHETEAVASLSNRISFINEDFKSYLQIEHKQTYEEQFQNAVNAEIDKKIKEVEALK